MREIKFRAFDKQKNRMFDVYGLGKDWVTEDTLDGVDEGNNCFNAEEFKSRIEIMQFTGLKDKNGVDIYEGDILQETNVYGDIRGEVLFSSAKFIRSHYYVDKKNHWLKTHGVFYDLHFYQLNQEIIGNIYQNPELL